MEIVPILSTIILVGTVATFILAVAAYILYKMREGGTQETELQLEREPHHVVMAVNHADGMYGGDSAPAEASMYYAPTATTPPSGSYVERNDTPGISSQQPGETQNSLPPNDEEFQGQPLNSFFWEYSNEGFAPINVHSGPDGKPRSQRMTSIDPDQERD